MPQKSNKKNVKLENKTVKRRTSTGKKTNGKKKSAKKISWKRKLLKFCLLTGLGLFLLLCGYIFYCYITLPDIQKAISQTREPSTVVLAENGNEVDKFGNIYADVIYPDKLPKNLTDAIIATEDKHFYRHFGFDFIGFTRAMVINTFKKRYSQGASTITQQVAKNIFLTPNKNIKRKVQELLLAFWLEHKLSKNQIMALYLNRVYFGSGAYGAQAAANWYFNKSVYDLNLREAAILAGMLKAPSRYNPIFKRKSSLERASVVLDNMRKNGYISQKQYEQALNLPISDGQKYRVKGAKHFAQYVYDEVNAFVGERSDDIVIMTTLDQKLQETAEKILRAKIYNAKGLNVSEGAVVIMDKSGAVKAMVGGVDFNRSQFNRAVQAKRQAGSSFKPFVYLTALQYGFTPESKIKDAPVTIGKWKPENYTKKYYGEVSLTYALAHSLNAATVNLSRELYLKDIAANAHKMGITTDINLTPSMVLGTSGVKVIDMAAAYTTIANGGMAVFPYAINEVATKDGRQIYVRQPDEKTRILDQKVVHDITTMLEKVINQGTGRKAQLPFFAAGKTGTTQNYRDAWFIGWTNRYVAAVWVGNDNDKPMNKVGGGNLPAEIWHDIMLSTVKDINVEDVDFSDIATDDDEKDDDIGTLIEKEGFDKSSTPSSSRKEPQSMEELIDTL